ncbi:MAG: hypothetical protein A2284_09365 [Deltaproteobacteria bacterium RIFOXYA12_FULL_61_11]|nr:MAG: hypothetical protein A2284_09365 [Deltaproteobacteria bacterium RIFOXYA12_FULL_61_11]
MPQGPGIATAVYPSPFGRLLFLFVAITPFVAFFLTATLWRWAPLLPLVVAEVYLYRNVRDLWLHSLFWPLFYLAIAACLPWPLTFVLPLAGYLALYGVWPRSRPSTRWLMRGRLTKATLGWMVPTIVLSSCALLGWVVLLRPDLSDLVHMIPPGGLLVLLAAGLTFSVFNAIWEEFILKGILWAGLESVLSRTWVVNIVQAILFGVIHYGGFPRGLTGAAMAALYGFAIGLIRSRSGGMLAPVVTHFFADATIFVILYLLSVGAIPVK